MGTRQDVPGNSGPACVAGKKPPEAVPIFTLRRINATVGWSGADRVLAQDLLRAAA